MIGQVKDCVASALDENGQDLEETEVYFLGANLSKLLLQVCILKNGATTDLLEVTDHVMGALNLLRYLLLRDGSTNKSGIMTEMPTIEALMLKPLRTALDLTKAHYNLRLKEIQSPGYRGGEQGSTLEAEFQRSVLIGGQEVEMEDIPVEAQLTAMNCGLRSLDIMESLLVRVNECYDNVKRSPPS